jgi:hypothetical protein
MMSILKKGFTCALNVLPGSALPGFTFITVRFKDFLECCPEVGRQFEKFPLDCFIR